jgi:hypothetical protein
VRAARAPSRRRLVRVRVRVGVRVRVRVKVRVRVRVGVEVRVRVRVRVRLPPRRRTAKNAGTQPLARRGIAPGWVRV